MDEIEKKYLLMENGVDHSTSHLQKISPSIDDLVREVMKRGELIDQGYLPLDIGMKLSEAIGINVHFSPKEARLRHVHGKTLFTMKGKGNLVREEIERAVPIEVFTNYWKHTHGSRVDKVRLKVPYSGHTAEIDVYTNRDLVVAEIEVPSIEIAQRLPPLGKDVTEDPRYKNRNLAR